MLEMLARATTALRAAEWNADASGESHAQEQTASGSLDPGRRTPDPGSGIPDPGSRIPDPGSRNVR